MDARHFQRNSDGSWSTGTMLEGLTERVELIVRPLDGGTSNSQPSAGLQFIDAWPLLRLALQPALFAFYCDTHAAATESGPSIAVADEVWAHVELAEIEVLADSHGNAAYIHCTGGCSWEEEHGLEVSARAPAELLYVGQYYGWTPEDTSLENDWNFALATNQAAAFAERAPTDDEIAELALSQAEELERVAPQNPTRRPWWKVW